MRSTAAQPSNALLLSRTRRSRPAHVTGRLQCNGHMVWKPAAVSAFDLAQRSRSRTLRVQQEVRSDALQPVDALPHGKRNGAAQLMLRTDSSCKEEAR